MSIWNYEHFQFNSGTAKDEHSGQYLRRSEWVYLRAVNLQCWTVCPCVEWFPTWLHFCGICALNKLVFVICRNFKDVFFSGSCLNKSILKSTQRCVIFLKELTSYVLLQNKNRAANNKLIRYRLDIKTRGWSLAVVGNNAAPTSHLGGLIFVPMGKL